MQTGAHIKASTIDITQHELSSSERTAVLGERFNLLGATKIALQHLARPACGATGGTNLVNLAQDVALPNKARAVLAMKICKK